MKKNNMFVELLELTPFYDFLRKTFIKNNQDKYTL